MTNIPFDLYLVTDRSQTLGRDLLWVLERALDGGVKAIQLREKDLGGKELFQLAEKTRKLTQRYQASLLINDRVDVVLAVDAEGVQLGKTSMPIQTARALMGPGRIIGASTHSPAEAQAAQENGADFVLFGPVYFTPSKASYGAPQGLAPLAEVVANVSIPVYAIGGVKLENLQESKATGIHGAALISAILSAEDPKQATQHMFKLLRQ